MPASELENKLILFLRNAIASQVREDVARQIINGVDFRVHYTREGKDNFTLTVHIRRDDNSIRAVKDTVLEDMLGS